MDDLIAFLRARLDEDVKVARDATFWTGGVPEWTSVRAEPDFVHIDRHDPARVLADVAAKRHIIEQCELRGRAVRTATLDGGFFEHLLRVLALPYADHPDYRKEWRP